MAHTDRDVVAPSDGDESGQDAGGAENAVDSERGSAGGHEPATDDAKTAHDEPHRSAFEAAIERKKAAGQQRSDHLYGGAKVSGSTSNRKTSRTFRRKSG